MIWRIWNYMYKVTHNHFQKSICVLQYMQRFRFIRNNCLSWQKRLCDAAAKMSHKALKQTSSHRCSWYGLEETTGIRWLMRIKMKTWIILMTSSAKWFAHNRCTILFEALLNRSSVVWSTRTFYKWSIVIHVAMRFTNYQMSNRNLIVIPNVNSYQCIFVYYSNNLNLENPVIVPHRAYTQECDQYKNKQHLFVFFM